MAAGGTFGEFLQDQLRPLGHDLAGHRVDVDDRIAP